ncbi:MAG: hypothetical protein ACOC8J_03970, partial [Ralstonia sp.]
MYLHLELARTLGYFYEPLKLPLLTLLWLALCGLLLHQAIVHESRVFLDLLLLVIAGLLVKLFGFDLPSWRITDRILYGGPYSFRDAALRFADFGAIVTFFAAAYALLVGRPQARSAGLFLGFASLS